MSRASTTEIRRLRAQLAEAREVLRLVEWEGCTDYGEASCCPVCGAYPEKGHAPDCRLAKALEGG